MGPMALQFVPLLRSYHQFLVRRAEAGDIVSRHIEGTVWAAPWVLIPLAGMAIAALTQAKFHLNHDQGALVLLPFLVIGGVGMIYVVAVFAITGVRKDLRKTRGPWSG